jgi:hypothetical protein
MELHISLPNSILKLGAREPHLGTTSPARISTRTCHFQSIQHHVTAESSREEARFGDKEVHHTEAENCERRENKKKNSLWNKEKKNYFNDIKKCKKKNYCEVYLNKKVIYI